MTRQALRSTLGTSLLVGFLALVAVTVAANSTVFHFDLGSGGGAAVAQAPGWSDLMGVLEACAAGSECAVSVASGDHTFHWTAEGPVLALTGADVVPCEAGSPAQAPGGTRVVDVDSGIGSHKLLP